MPTLDYEDAEYSGPEDYGNATNDPQTAAADDGDDEDENEEMDVDEFLEALQGESGDDNDVKTAGMEMDEDEDDSMLKELMESLPELEEERTLEQKVLASSNESISSDLRSRSLIPEVGVIRPPRDWRQLAQQQDILLQWVNRLTHFAKASLMRMTEFPKSFCALHLLFLICSQVPVPTLLTAYPSTNENGIEEKENSPRRYRLLYNTLWVAYRGASREVDSRVEVIGLGRLFHSSFDPTLPAVQTTFQALMNGTTAEKNVALHRAYNAILKTVHTRLSSDAEASNIHDQILTHIRRDAVDKRSRRATERAVFRAQAIAT
eukprot:Protomagalhaensia_sp_Gyna_25__591@NODE_127_length_5035_cov_121_183547_g100_i0_p2_GENE_NODE_127_length_5035_cov_121_183547_g100_i0NODE_127_length_5035_cov_121_183547_g100_i0_p2_ORF_typecomplete_len320_score63_15SDA1/PF05285_12/0_0071Nop14/PF04147_12/0_011GET2/PF08690_10/0_13_NODE_127_length_5035_cov_121_183547_g100_i033684327